MADVVDVAAVVAVTVVVVVAVTVVVVVAVNVAVVIVAVLVFSFFVLGYCDVVLFSMVQCLLEVPTLTLYKQLFRY